MNAACTTSRVMAFIMAGGKGDRLSALSEQRAKPAVPFGGSYRIIDFALSNCANSGITRVGVLTQYLPRSLNEHIAGGGPWGLDRDNDGVTILQPYRGCGVEGNSYCGTADSVYQNLHQIRDYGADTVLVLAGDHVYSADYRDMVAYHRQHDAELTVAVTRVPIEDASRYGLVTLDDERRVRGFEEKPEYPTHNLVSMGFYVFNASYLIDALLADAEDDQSTHDFGHDVLPRAVESGAKMYGFRFDGYWRDIGTVEAYWEANMDLLEDPPSVRLDEPGACIYTRSSSRPLARFGPTAEVRQAIIGRGSVIHGAVEHSILSPGAIVEAGAVVRDSVLFGDVRVESGAVVERSILDEEVVIGRGAHIGTGDDLSANVERPDLLWSGINVIGKRTQIPSRFEIRRNTVVGALMSEEIQHLTSLPVGATVRSPRTREPFTV